ncbi:hypothetical protein [Arthrospiribacter ruber]|uniref:Uncharacterized protein n=1 Tax=Arthrospiribacter ruber TaxID=2487934 RepID=A0A951MFK9_9BACT|nr:hypothetical protein [Arthrospiribacter ruber]MBW3469075.1 hypothetical protein [Arthrospiribacter ruber]
MAFAIEVGLSIEEYYNLTPIEFKRVQEGYNYRLRQQYEIARLIGYTNLKPYLDKQHQDKSLEQLIPFSWDKKKEIKHTPISKEEYYEMIEKFKFNE